ncbi:hypothetical protein Bca4012_016899 [Brassica carinata]
MTFLILISTECSTSFFESKNNVTDPVVLWLTGGLGCSGSLALFTENGPFAISENLSLSWNPYGWDKVSNVIYVDQPVGTGFSNMSDTSLLRHDETGVSSDLYDFLQAFFKEHPQLWKNDFYITGESYDGHYIPALASRIRSGNKNKEGIPINLKGLAIGNGMTNPEIQYGAYADYALEMKLISQSIHESLNQVYVDCQSSIRICKNVRKALGVGENKWELCRDNVHEAMTEDWMINLEVNIPALVEDGINLLIYAGEYDFICNWLGNSRWVEQMNWSGQKEFGSAKTVPFLVDGKEAGFVHDARHMVPMDQPKASLQMLKTWIQGQLATPPNALVR